MAKIKFKDGVDIETTGTIEAKKLTIANTIELTNGGVCISKQDLSTLDGDRVYFIIDLMSNGTPDVGAIPVWDGADFVPTNVPVNPTFR